MQARLFVASAVLAMAGAAFGVEKTFTIQEPFGLAWGPDRVCYQVEFAQGQAKADGLGLKNAQGQPVAVQVTDAALWPDGSLKAARVWFMVSLKPDERGVWTLSTADKPTQPASDLVVKEGDVIELANARTGIRLVGGKKTFAEPVAGDKLPGPIQGVRLPDGRRIGKGSWQTDVKCTGYSAEVTERGPVFARAKLRYDFEGGRFYAATVELSAGQDLAVISEEYNLSEGKRYPMLSGLSGGPPLTGMKPDVQYGYVPPHFTSPDRALVWDWWGQSQARLPTYNAYSFSFYEGLEPDEVEFSGHNAYQHIQMPVTAHRPPVAHGKLVYDQDGRFAYLNAFPQWGDEESCFLGFSNSKKPEVMLAVIGLLPSQWLHPDIDPHPDDGIHQYVQTTCIRFERRKSGDVFFRAPADLGKRVYGIGGVQATFGRHLSLDVLHWADNTPTSAEVWGGDLVTKHVRMGRLPLDQLKDWVLDYPEPVKYPCVYVTPGDRVAYESRRTRKPADQVRAELAAQKEPTDADRKVVSTALYRTRFLARYFAQVDLDMMYVGIQEGLLADQSEDALSSPACTPQQAQELRKYLAATAYYALSFDFMPPRTAGFGWGAANQSAQVQCRSAPLVALLPNHPQSKAWRQRLAKVATLYFEDEVNEHGVMMECPGYGTMTIMMPAMALAALANAGDVDLSHVLPRFRAAARLRLSILLPYDLRGGFRSVCPEGDTYYAGDGTFAALAGLFQKSDPDLARQLAWGVAESNNNLGGHADPSYKLFDPGLEPLQPKLASEHFPGYGVVMRNGFPARDEAYVQIFAGSFCWGHGRPDRGAWVMYAKGAPLMVPFASMYTPQFHQTWQHPGGLSFNHDETVRNARTRGSDDWWRKGPAPVYRNSLKAPFTSLQIAASPTSSADIDLRGEVTAFKITRLADYAEMKRNVSRLTRVPYMFKEIHGEDQYTEAISQDVYLKNPFLWTRRFVFVKDYSPRGHNYLVIRDDLPGNTELDPNLNLWCLASEVNVMQDGKSIARSRFCDARGLAQDIRVDSARQTIVYTGQNGVDLHCYIAEPARFVAKTRTLGHNNGFGFAAYHEKTFNKKFREDQIQVQIPQRRRGAGYFAALVPLKEGEKVPTFETLADGKAIRVTFHDRTDTIVLQPKATEIEVEGKKISSLAAVVMKRGKDLQVIDLAGK